VRRVEAAESFSEIFAYLSESNSPLRHQKNPSGFVAIAPTIVLSLKALLPRISTPGDGEAAPLVDSKHEGRGLATHDRVNLDPGEVVALALVQRVNAGDVLSPPAPGRSGLPGLNVDAIRNGAGETLSGPTTLKSLRTRRSRR